MVSHSRGLPTIRAKLASGQAICLAEVISDGAHRQRGQAKRLSTNERSCTSEQGDFWPMRSDTRAASTQHRPRTG